MLALLQNAFSELETVAVIASAGLTPLSAERVGESLGVIRSALNVKRIQLGLQPRGRQEAE